MSSDDDDMLIDTTRSVHQLLEDFDVVATLQEVALVARGPYRGALRQNARAALVATGMRLKSLDYAKKRYCSNKHDQHGEFDTPSHKYVDAYQLAKHYVHRMINKLSPEDRPDPSYGVYGSSIVLQRLPQSFFSAHLLYRLGQRYEGHAVSRIILEQLGWAYVACSLDSIEKIESIVTTKTISKLKEITPEAGQLYGELSQGVHIDYRSHGDFLTIHPDGGGAILFTQYEYRKYANIILSLADLFGIVWEISQRDYIDKFDSIYMDRGRPVVNPERSFVGLMREQLLEIDRAMQHRSAMDTR